MTSDPFNLHRFLDAQEPVIDRVLAELRTGQKRSHWMWFVFPQVAGLGFSQMAQRYAIGSRDEAKAYLAHPVLGLRLKQCTQAVLDVEGRSIHAIFGSPDDVKFRSSVTLFADVAPGETLFEEALTKYFGGEADQKTLDLLP